MHQARTVLGIVICVIIALESSPKLAHKQKGPVLLNTYHPHIPGPQKVLSAHTADKQCYHDLNAISTKPMLLTLYKVFPLWSSCYMARHFANDFS